MITILVIWKERGYLRDTFWATESCPVELGKATARRLVKAALAIPGAFQVRAKVGGAR